jgi:peptide/nickel transport system permease protein
MLGYALTRIAVALGLIWAVATLVFLIIHFVPGDPAELLLSQGGVAPDPSAVAELREKLGLDQPLLTQYLGDVGGLLRGDLGSSLLDDHSVASEIALRLPRTLELIFAASLISVLFGLPLGTLAALRAGSPTDRVLAGAAPSRSALALSYSA